MKALYGYPISEDVEGNKVKPITHLKEFQKSLKFLKEHLNDNVYKQRYLTFSLANENDIPTLSKTRGYHWNSKVIGAICLRMDVRKIAQKYIGRKEDFVLSAVTTSSDTVTFFFEKFDPYRTSHGYGDYLEGYMKQKPSADDCKKLANDLQKVFRQSGWNATIIEVSVNEDNSGYAYGITNKPKYCYRIEVKI